MRFGLFLLFDEDAVAIALGMRHIPRLPALPDGCGCSSGVEHNLAKVGVEGSNPFARSKIKRRPQALFP